MPAWACNSRIDVQGAFDKEYPTLGPRPVPGREYWQSPVQEPASGRSDTEQWTSRLADVVPPSAANVSPLLPATGTGAAALAASASAPHTPRMADAVQQVRNPSQPLACLIRTADLAPCWKGAPVWGP